jgi:hypothetical protein
MNPKIGKTPVPVNQHVAWALAESNDCRVRLEQQPLFEQWAPVERHATRELRAIRLEPMRAPRADKRHRLCDAQRISHKINALRTGFEV